MKPYAERFQIMVTRETLELLVRMLDSQGLAHGLHELLEDDGALSKRPTSPAVGEGTAAERPGRSAPKRRVRRVRKTKG